MTRAGGPFDRPSRGSAWPLVALLVFLSVANALWARLGGGPLHWDSAVHLIEGLDAHRWGGDATRPYWKQFLYASWYYPPLVSYVCIPFYTLLGESLLVALRVMDFFLLVLVASTWGIARRLYDRDTALAAAFAVAMCPIAMEYSRDFMLDLPLAAMVALAMLALLRTDGFRGTGRSLLAGLALGLGLLTRWTFVFFLAVPLLVAGVHAFRGRQGRAARLANLAGALLAGAAVSAPWYAVRALQILTTRLGELGRGARGPLRSATYYLEVLPQQTSWLLALALLAGVVLALRASRRPPAALVAWFAGSYAILSVVGFKQPRFSIPLLAPLAIVAAAGWIAWRDRAPAGRRGRSRAMAAAAVALVVQHLLVTFVPADSAAGRALGRPLLGAPLLAVRGPEGRRWGQAEILERIERLRREAGAPRAVVRFLPDHVHFNRQTLEYAVAMRRAPVVVAGLAGFPLGADFVVVKTGDPGATTERGLRRTEAVLADARGPDPLYGEVGRFPLPDGSEAVLLRVERRRVPAVPAAVVREQVRRRAEGFLRRFLRPEAGYALDVELGDAAEVAQGRIRSLRLRADRARVGDFAFDPRGLPARGLDVELSDVVVDPVALARADSLEVLAVGGLRVSGAAIGARDLGEYVEASTRRGVVVDSLAFERDELRLVAHRPGSGWRLRARVALRTVEHRNVAFEFRELRVGPVPVPPGLVNAMTDAYNPVVRGLDGLTDLWVGDLVLTRGTMALRDPARAAR